MILSVIRFEIDDGDTTRAIAKQWKAYQKHIVWISMASQLVQNPTTFQRHATLISVLPACSGLGGPRSYIETGGYVRMDDPGSIRTRFVNDTPLQVSRSRGERCA
jgi:hypothetical protein